jgi:RND family efflux transporter MFP subunit
VLARIDQAKADIAGAQVAVGYSRVTSPLSGVVASKPAEVGTLAAPGVPLVMVEDDGRYRLEASVEESRIGHIHPGDRAAVRIDALGDGELEGRVEEVAPVADPATRTYLVKIGLPAPKAGRLRSGLFGRALFRTGERQALLVPQRAVVEQGQLSGVFAVETGNVARLRLVRVGKREGDRVEVLSGLTAGERIVVEGREMVADGVRIQ